MKVNVIGGGPGGLYASILLKKANPDWEVVVHERDPADNTYGWGVVFSDATLTKLREADHESHEAITDAFVRWNPIDVYYDGEHLRCGGHGFAGVMRTDLLGVLQDRCADLGVELHFESNVEDPEELRDGADLVVGADGASSMTRERYAETFQPSIVEGDAKFAWFGTEKPFDVFTFVFRENEHGLWQIHAYPGRKSTFIVECTEETWRNAGLDWKGEAEALAYFEELFADHLDGYDLESKLYGWREFPTVRNRTWHHEEVVLLGDSAHTAHFSIGSGTKMAMEDAVALWEAFEEHGTDVDSALDWYEKERRPRVEALQEAGERSKEYFEHVGRYLHLDAEQFAFNLLTRSGRISYDSLRVRDPAFVDGFDRWYARAADAVGDAESGGGPRRAVAAPPMLKSLTLRETTVPNRVVLAPQPPADATDGLPGEDYLDRFVARGTDGAGLVVADQVAVSADGRITPETAGLYDDAHRDAWADAIERIRDGGDTRIGLRLVHAGRRGATRPRRYGLDLPLPEEEAWPLLSASATAFSADSRTPTPMDEEDLAAVREEFARAADRAADAGFDVVNVQLGHGYLLASFLSPLINKRDDEYGGSLENRMRYPVETFEAVRDAWPDDRPAMATVPATDWVPPGFDLDDASTLAGTLADRGCDAVSVVAGQTTAKERPDYDTDALGRYAEHVRNEAEVPTVTTGYVTSYDGANTLVGGGRADLCRLYPENLDPAAWR